MSNIIEEVQCRGVFEHTAKLDKCFVSNSCIGSYGRYIQRQLYLKVYVLHVIFLLRIQTIFYEYLRINKNARTRMIWWALCLLKKCILFIF